MTTLWQMTAVRAHINYALVLAFLLWDVGFFFLILSSRSQSHETNRITKGL